MWIALKINPVIITAQCWFFVACWMRFWSTPRNNNSSPTAGSNAIIERFMIKSKFVCVTKKDSVSFSASVSMLRIIFSIAANEAGNWRWLFQSSSKLINGDRHIVTTTITAICKKLIFLNWKNRLILSEKSQPHSQAGTSISPSCENIWINFMALM